MSKFVRIASIAGLTVGLLGSGTAVAFAGTHPTPTPTPTPTVPAPVPANWTFDLSQLHVNRGPVLPDINVNNVEGRGALLMRGWADVNGTNPRVDTFRLGANSVTLRHSPLRLANFTVNRYTCTVNINQTGRFVITNGTGTGANLRVIRNSGQFELDGQLSFPLVRGNVCVLRFVSLATIIRAAQAGNPVLGVNPNLSSFSVQGRALVVRTAPVIRPFAPVASPSA